MFRFDHAGTVPPRLMITSCILLALARSASSFAQADPAAEPAVLALGKVLPAVVNINTERVVRRTVRDPVEDFYAQFFGYYRGQPREIRQTVQSLGSGFIVDPAGYIVTNQHVVERAADLKIQVTTNDSKTYNAHYITGDDNTDLAFIKIDAKAAFPFISLDNISPNLLGETVLVVGNAVGYGSSISRGVLSATKREITIDNIEYKNLVQTDAAINPGNSGGPVIDISGRLVGISSAKMAFTPQGIPTQGLGFAIPAEVVRDSVAQFKKVAEKQPEPKKQLAANETSTSLAERLFGMQLQDLSGELTDALGYARGRGVLISAVEPNSPADQAGIERGLVIYRVGKQDVNSMRQVEDLLGAARSGTSVDFTVGVVRADRGGQRVETVTLAAR
ncbi:MAG: serine protease [Verrucomicrobia bacterium]|nr:MAG: serine protease [Verrucomicrobiota bacterium]PYK93531.1 MAG: serine protease [Verrucomicrobiota bacterium]PYL39078.1 MAG: serine protease [Verrucomicrobiota bacterium]PYL56938.1 MAG: serine protease [Verrucomicrobiota bacterium]